jgi:hypothetical protein
MPITISGNADLIGALEILELTIEDAISFPVLKNQPEIGRRSRELVEKMRSGTVEAINVHDVKLIVLVQRMALRTFGSNRKNQELLDKDFGSFSNMINNSSYSENEKNSIYDMAAYFSPLVREFCESEKAEIDTLDLDRHLLNLMKMCHHNIDMLASRSCV